MRRCLRFGQEMDWALTGAHQICHCKLKKKKKKKRERQMGVWARNGPGLDRSPPNMPLQAKKRRREKDKWACCMHLLYEYAIAIYIIYYNS
jgi:hypothetical protein